MGICELTDLRQRIDKINIQILDLLNLRISLVEKIAEMKDHAGMD